MARMLYSVLTKVEHSDHTENVFYVQVHVIEVCDGRVEALLRMNEVIERYYGADSKLKVSIIDAFPICPKDAINAYPISAGSIEIKNGKLVSADPEKFEFTDDITKNVYRG